MRLYLGFYLPAGRANNGRRGLRTRGDNGRTPRRGLNTSVEQTSDTNSASVDNAHPSGSVDASADAPPTTLSSPHYLGLVAVEASAATGAAAATISMAQGAKTVTRKAKRKGSQHRRRGAQGSTTIVSAARSEDDDYCNDMPSGAHGGETIAKRARRERRPSRKMLEARTALNTDDESFSS